VTTETPDGPQQDWSVTPDVLPDVLAAQPGPAPGRRASWPLVAAAAALVLALVGGVTYAVGALSGGGQQAADALPGGALGLLSVDLDPPAGQKIDGYRFLRKFPSLRDHVPLDGDAREIVFDAIADEAGWADIDFDADVSPWLGKRLAVALYPPAGQGSEPVVVVALQVTDTDGADAGLEKLATAARRGTGDATPVGWAFSGDYALITENSMIAKDLADRSGAAPLSADEHFAADTASTDDGVVLAWADLGRAGEVLGDTAAVPQAFGGSATGRTTMVARFDGPDVFELSGTTTGVDGAGWAQHEVQGMADLPASTAVAFGLADGDDLAARAWDAAKGFFGLFSESRDDGAAADELLGLHMPDDLATLLGSNLLLAVDGGESDQVQVGARITTDVAAANRVLDTLEQHQGGLLVPEFALVRRTVGDDLVVAATRAQADRLAGDGALGDEESFRSALPDLDDAALALWVDPAGAQAAFGLGGEPDPDLEPLDGVGVTVSSISDGTASFRLRLVAP
jgi:hypothetical protein